MKLGTATDSIFEEKREEVELVLEVADIIDELNSLTRLLDQQTDTLKVAMARSDSLKAMLHEEDVLFDIENHQLQVKRLIKDAQRTHRSVSYLRPSELGGVPLTFYTSCSF